MELVVIRVRRRREVSRRELIVAIFVGIVCVAGFVIGFNRLDLWVGTKEAQSQTPTVTEGTGNTDELSRALAIHGVSIPADAINISYTVSVGLDSHKLGLVFETSPAGMEELLLSIDRSTADLTEDMYPWDELQFYDDTPPERYAWNLESITDFAGLIVREPPPYRYALLVQYSEENSVVVFLDAVDL